MEVVKEKDMKLLSRKRATILLDNSQKGTPSRAELIKKVAEHYKVDESLVVIKHIYSQFGKSKTKIIVHIYDDKEKMKMFEHESLLKKHSLKGNAEEKPAEPGKDQESAAENPGSPDKTDSGKSNESKESTESSEKAGMQKSENNDANTEKSE